MASKVKVVILGAGGMLGHMVRRVLSAHPHYHLTCPSRQFFDLSAATLPLLQNLLAQHDWVVNCAGVVKPRIDEADRRSVEQAMRVNAFLPHLLAEAAESTLVGGRCRVLQIATDCVYSGRVGGAISCAPYTESSLHDALDVYGRTKSLGEVRSPLVHHLRCSIIGPEQRRPTRSLLEWFLGQPLGAQVSGYTNHYWNGLTTLAFARICHGVMSEGVSLPAIQHVVPGKFSLFKYDLLCHFARAYSRTDIQIDALETPTIIDRTLWTDSYKTNKELWQAAGYPTAPSPAALIAELAAYTRSETAQ